MRLTAKGRHLFDADGRVVLLRGVNAGGRSKLPPFLPFPFAEAGVDAPALEDAAAAYAERARLWGCNCVRLPFTWEAVEPERGRYDDVFLERYVALARAFGERGMRVVVDFHQDVFARPFAGDGFPLWAVPEGDWPAPNPHLWFLGYVQHAGVQQAFDRFWANEDGLRDAFAAMWRHVATRLWREPYVVGFEVINEPGWGSADAMTWAPEVLTPFYTEMVAVIREVAPGALVFFDSTGAEALSAKTFLERPLGDGLVFAPHYYEGSVILTGSWNGRGDFVKALGAWDETGAAWDVPVLLGEFGCQAHVDRAVEYVRAHYEAMDGLWMHGTQWEYSTDTLDWNDEGLSLCAPDGSENGTVEALVRAYPRAVAGRNPTFRYDASTRTGVLSCAALEGVTEVAAPARLYPETLAVSLSGPAATGATWEASDGVLRVRTTGSGALTIRFGPQIA